MARSVNPEHLREQWIQPPEPLVSSTSGLEESREGHGRIELVAERDEDGRTHLARSESEIPLAIQRRISTSSPGQPGRVCVVTPGGGQLGGDTLQKKIHCRSGSYLRVEDTGMQRIYGMKPGDYCQQQTEITVESGACLEWIPGPFLPYAESSYHEFVQFDLHDDSSLFVPFILLPGRMAHGENGEYNYYGKRVIGWNSTRRHGNSDNFSGLRFCDSLTLGQKVNSTPDECMTTLLLLLENERKNDGFMEDLRSVPDTYETVRGGVSLLDDGRTSVIQLASPEWEVLVDCINDLYVKFRKEMGVSKDPEPFLFTAG